MSAHWNGVVETVLARCSNHCDTSGNMKDQDDIKVRTLAVPVALLFAHKPLLMIMSSPREENGGSG